MSMDRLTYDFKIGGSHCWQVKGADNLECREVCQRQEDRGCTDCPIAKAFERLSAYEETGLEPGEIEQLKGEVFGLRLDKQELSALGPIDRLRELAQADKDGKIKAYIVDSFYCDICQKRHDRIKEIKVYLTRDAAEAALSERR